MKARSTTASRTERLLGRTLGAAAAAGALAWLVTAGGQAGPPAAEQVTSARAVADEAPGYAVETFDYPQADEILQEQGIALKRGDGHITLATCATGTGQLEIYSRVNQKVCFRVTGATGWLTLEVASVYGVQTPGYATDLDMTVDAEEKSYEVPANSWQAVGQSADPEGRPHMLVEIRTSK
ncbi:hypothetical protein [Streptomyces sp. CRN 30]|uniref:hypothetical protein n=1 Tax=Streptomyces sp. CRN 30 TaxID=3075613 RepID=UPI002A81DD6B|nr:hypothetical protein [Streptomyces sp. CRN 30]